MSYIDKRAAQFYSYSNNTFHKLYNSLSNSWVRLSTDWSAPGLYIQGGFIYGRGLVNSGSVGTIFTPDDPFLPYLTHIYSTPSGPSTAGGRIDHSNTTVAASVVNGGWLSLDAIRTPLDILQFVDISSSLTNSWVSYGLTFEAPHVYKDELGFVHMCGTIKDGTLSTSFYTLPADYRPAKTVRFPVVSGGSQAGYVNIASNGTCTIFGPSNLAMSLNNIVFMAESSPLHNDYVELTSSDLESGYSVNDGSTYYPLAYFIAPNGRVYWRGVVDVDSPSVSLSTINIATLPANIRPTLGVMFGNYSNGGLTLIRINNNSTYLSAVNLTGTSLLFYDGMHYVYPKQSLGSLL